ncbi:MAG: CrcB family protein [Hyphomicrobium sp.]|nr:CrcB family protein [Hyphomicrobium sp.]
MKLIMLAAAGGGIGAAARLLVNQAFAGAAFPWATLAVNIVGSFLMGMTVVFVTERFGGSAEMRTFLATGILGGFTTFSAFSFDVVELMAKEGPLMTGLYIGGSVVGAIAAIVVGLSVARAMFA